MARFLIFERDKESEQNDSTAYLLYDESHFVKLDDVAAKNQKLQQNGISEEVYCSPQKLITKKARIPTMIAIFDFLKNIIL